MAETVQINGVTVPRSAYLLAFGRDTNFRKEQFGLTGVAQEVLSSNSQRVAIIFANESPGDPAVFRPDGQGAGGGGSVTIGTDRTIVLTIADLGSLIQSAWSGFTNAAPALVNVTEVFVLSKGPFKCA